MMSNPINIIPNEQNTASIAILPGEKVSFFNVELPALPENKLLKILPGIMADYVAGDVKEMHLSLIEKMPDGRHLVSVCDEKWLQEAKRTANEKNKSIKAIWPDYALLAVPEKDVAIMKLSGRILARRADGTGFNVNERFLEHVIGDLPVKEVFESRSVPNGAGLASGKFSARPPLLSYIRALKRIAILCVIGSLIWIISSLLAISQLEQEWERYQVANEEIFRSTYPEVTRVVNVEAQMRALGSSVENGGRSDFSHLTNTIFKAVSETPGVAIESMSFDASGSTTNIDVTVSTASFALAGVFENTLKLEGFLVTQGESGQSGETILTSFQLKEEAND